MSTNGHKTLNQLKNDIDRARAKRSMKRLSKFLRGYLEAAIWTSEEEIGKDHTIYDFSGKALREAARDCENFEDQNRDDLDETSADDEQHGHDFWLTRNRHGVGFWDRGYAKNKANRLTASAHAFGEVNVMLNEHGQLIFA